jgi:hypothetical protein
LNIFNYPGNSAKSKLFIRTSQDETSNPMPPDGLLRPKGPNALPANQLSKEQLLIKNFIDQLK